MISDGQDMAERIARQLSSNTEKLKKAVLQYNSNFGEELSYQDISSPQKTQRLFIKIIPRVECQWVFVKIMSASFNLLFREELSYQDISYPWTDFYN